MRYKILNPALSQSEATRAIRADRALDLFSTLQDSAHSAMKKWHFWEVIYEKMRSHLTPDFLHSFQSDQVLGSSIVGAGGRHFLERLRERYGTRYLSLLLANFSESLCGNPLDLELVDSAHITRTSMRHLYYFAHLHNYLLLFSPAQTKLVVEIGGGFGNLARIALQFSLAKRYLIIDFPPLLAVQYYFLSEFFDEKEIAVVDTRGVYLNGGSRSKIILLTPQALGQAYGTSLLAEPYWLVSTFALTEAPQETQDIYLQSLTPELMYVMGQEQTLNAAEGKPVGEFALNNLPLVHQLIERYHVVHYDAWGWNFELLVREKFFGENVS